MKRAMMEMLSKVFEEEIGGGMLQRNNKLLKELAHDGYVEHVSRKDGSGWMQVTCSGYILTQRGRITYCEHCANKEAV